MVGHLTVGEGAKIATSLAESLSANSGIRDGVAPNRLKRSVAGPIDSQEACSLASDTEW